MNIKMSLSLLVGFTVLSTMGSQAIAADHDRRDSRDQRRAERRVEQAQKNAFQAQQQSYKDQQRAAQRMAKQQNRVARRIEHDIKTSNNNNVRFPTPNVNVRRDWDRQRANNDRRFDNRWRNDRDDRRWDNDDRRRYQAAVNRNFRNWNEQRDYVRANLKRINQIAKLNAIQQQQLDAQMRAAYLQYHNNNWNGPYGWDDHSEPQFLDYLQSNQPSLMDRILGYLGVGGLGTAGGFGGNYLYSPNWNTERDQLAQNMFRIHQLALEGRITPLQEQQLLAQMRNEFSAYHHNNWNGGYGWSQYSDPGFLDYLNTSRPSILTTIRSYLGM